MLKLLCLYHDTSPHEIQGSTMTPETDSKSRVVQSGPCFVSVLKIEDSTISAVIT